MNYSRLLFYRIYKHLELNVPRFERCSKLVLESVYSGAPFSLRRQKQLTEYNSEMYFANTVPSPMLQQFGQSSWQAEHMAGIPSPELRRGQTRNSREHSGER